MVSEPVKANDGQKTVPPNALTRSGALHLLQWAWDELNVRPHAYQASVGQRRSPARCRFHSRRARLRRTSLPLMWELAGPNGEQNGEPTSEITSFMDRADSELAREGPLRHRRYQIAPFPSHPRLSCNSPASPCYLASPARTQPGRGRRTCVRGHANADARDAAMSRRRNER